MLAPSISSLRSGAGAAPTWFSRLRAVRSSSRPGSPRSLSRLPSGSGTLTCTIVGSSGSARMWVWNEAISTKIERLAVDRPTL